MNSSETNSCIICCESLGDKVFGSTVPCGHLFHQECFDTWRASSYRNGTDVKCPACNSICNEDVPFVRLYLDLNNKPEDNCFNQEAVDVVVTYEFNTPGFTDVDIQILVNGKKAGTAQAVLIDRTNLSREDFLSEMDAYSYDTQWLSLILFEPKCGRTKLESLDDFDDAKSPVLYIKMFEVKGDYKSVDESDVGTFALRKILQHPLFRGTSSAFYVADGSEAKTKEQEEIMARNDANQFLRNGFFQDESYANIGTREARILVASRSHWEQPLKSHQVAAEIQFFNQPEIIDTPEGPDGEIFNYVSKECMADRLQTSGDTYTGSEEVSQSAVELMIPPGRLGIALIGYPAKFASIENESPLFGNAEVGDVITSIILGDGTEMRDLDAKELFSMLQETSDDPNRKLILNEDNVAAPSSNLEVSIPAGSLKIRLSGDPPCITLVADDSPLAGRVQEGDVISTLILGDGTELAGVGADILIQMLTDTQSDTNRSIIIDRSADRGSSSQLPPKELMLPTGRLGIAVKGYPAVISNMANDSPLNGDLEVGDVVTSIILGDGMELTNFDAMEFQSILLETSNDPDRRLILNMDHEASLSSTREENTPIDSHNLSLVRENFLRQLKSNGGSIAGSDALHVAIKNNSFEMVKILLGIEPKAINSLSRSDLTPLMCAAISAAGRSNDYGIKDTNIIDYLLKLGANKDMRNQSGMTAYGKYLEKWRYYEFMYDSIMGRPPTPISARPRHPTEKRLMKLLCPVSGPTEADLCSEDQNSGFVESMKRLIHMISSNMSPLTLTDLTIMIAIFSMMMYFLQNSKPSIKLEF